MMENIQEKYNEADSLYLKGELDQSSVLFNDVIIKNPTHFPSVKRMLEINILLKKYSEVAERAEQYISSSSKKNELCILYLLEYIVYLLGGKEEDVIENIRTRMQRHYTKIKESIDFDLEYLLRRLEAGQIHPEVLKKIRGSMVPFHLFLWEWYYNKSNELSDMSDTHKLARYEDLHPLRYSGYFENGKICFNLNKSGSGRVAKDVSLHWFHLMAANHYDELCELLNEHGYILKQEQSQFWKKADEDKNLYFEISVRIWDITGLMDWKEVLFQIKPADNSSALIVSTDRKDKLDIEQLCPDTRKKLELVSREKKCRCPICENYREIQKKQFMINLVKNEKARSLFKEALFSHKEQEEEKRSKLLGTKVYLWDRDYNNYVYSLYSQAIEREKNGFIYLMRGKYASMHCYDNLGNASENFNHAIELLPDNAFFHYIRGKYNDDFQEEQKRNKIKDLSFAIKNFKIPDEIDEWKNALFKRALTYQYDDQYEKAVRDYKILLNEDSSTSLYFKQLMKILLQQGKYDRAFTFLVQLSQKRIKSIPKLMNVWKQETGRIKKLKKQKTRDDAIDRVTDHMASVFDYLNETHERIALNLARLVEYEDLGATYMEYGNFERAISVYQAVFDNIEHGLGRDKEDLGFYKAYQLYCLIGLCYFKLKRLNKAEEAYREAIDYMDNDYKAYCNLAEIYAAQKDYERAREILEKGIDKDEENAAKIKKLLKKYSSKFISKRRGKRI